MLNVDCHHHHHHEEEDFGCMLHAEGLKELIGSMPMKPKNP